MIIGICGKKRSGKDAVSDIICSTAIHSNFVRYSFADPLKRGAMEIFGFSESQLWGSEEEKETIDSRWGLSPRSALQILGTELLQFEMGKYCNEFAEKIGRNIWTKRFESWYNEFENKPNVVIPDTRFEHEIKLIKEMNGQIWEVRRDSIDATDGHKSENEWTSFQPDQIIYNDGSLADLELKVKSMICKHIL